jgi:hydroxylamine reductase (hybrid-cluster protein)
MNLFTLLCIAIAVFAFFSILLITFIWRLNVLTIKISQMSYNIHLMKNEVDENTLSITDCAETLQTSVTKSLEYIEEKSKEQIMPLPQLSKMITETIAEHVNLHIKMNQDRNIVPKTEFDEIVIAVCMTYPNVDRKYIIMKVAAVIESMDFVVQ